MNNSAKYFLLPFKFHRLGQYEILVNEIGDYLVYPPGTVEKVIHHQLQAKDEIYKDLISSFFISETPIPQLIDNYAVRLRTKKAFLNNFTALHIFVLTLRCNQNCIYCQASSRKEHEQGFDMTPESIFAAVDLMFRSPSPAVTMEFQGGEPSLVPELIRCAIEHAEEQNRIHEKHITYVLCTNCVNLSEGILELCEKYNVLISTSLDGPEFLHNYNRGKSDSYSNVIAGINRARTRLGKERVSALMTTSEQSLSCPKAIVDAYRENGFHRIFIRPLNPYGLAQSKDWKDYYGNFIEFYKNMLEYIIGLNQAGELFIEEFTALILRKILTPFSTGFVDLQSPAGIVNSVAVYNYDGFVYASDESRMLAEKGDYTFRLGQMTDRYEDIFYGRKAQKMATLWGTEFIAGCADCAFQAYCGADPVRNYTAQNDPYGFRPNSYFCQKHKAIFEYIFYLLIEREKEVMPIFKRWLVESNF